MQHVLVTGGAGYIGSHTVQALLKNKYKVSVIDDLSAGHKECVSDAAHFYEGDFSDVAILNEIHTCQKIDVVFHFAAFLKVNESFLFPDKYKIIMSKKQKHSLVFAAAKV